MSTSYEEPKETGSGTPSLAELAHYFLNRWGYKDVHLVRDEKEKGFSFSHSEGIEYLTFYDSHIKNCMEENLFNWREHFYKLSENEIWE